MNHLEQMCRDHFNEPVLLYDTLARVIGYGEDEDDAYIICRHLKTTFSDELGDIRWHTCVGGYIFLDLLKQQGQVDAWNGEKWNDFTRLDGFLTLNGAPEEPEFLSKSK